MAARRNKARIIAAVTAVALGCGAATLHYRCLTADLARLRAIQAEVVKATDANASARAVAPQLPELQAVHQRSARRVPPDANLGPVLCEERGRVCGLPEPEDAVVSLELVEVPCGIGAGHQQRGLGHRRGSSQMLAVMPPST